MSFKDTVDVLQEFLGNRSILIQVDPRVYVIHFGNTSLRVQLLRGGEIAYTCHVHSLSKPMEIPDVEDESQWETLPSDLQELCDSAEGEAQIREEERVLRETEVR